MKYLFLRKKVLLEKKIGKTPLETIVEWKEKHPRYKDIPATYAGRLDPMASGKLLVLFGEECKKREQYLALDKTYDIEILLGVGSDTGDVLGLVSSRQASGGSDTAAVGRSEIVTALQKEIGSYELLYPAFSSKTVNGKPLFLYALEGTLPSIKIPTHTESIYSLQLVHSYQMTTSELTKKINSLLALAPVSDTPSKGLGADFRLHDVQKSWSAIFNYEKKYTILKVRVACGSGAYMRSLAGRIGENLDTKALALSIHRSALTKKNR